MAIITEIEDKLVLDNYIKDQKSRGFNPEEIKEQLFDAGWDKTLVEEMLKANLDQTQSFLEKTDATSQFSQYSSYLTEDENITTNYKIGFYVILITNIRVIIIRRFPKTITKIDYDDIELIEYYTDIEWKKLIYGIIYGLAALILFIFDALISPKLAKTIIFLAPYFKTDFVLGINPITFTIIVIFTILCIRYCISYYDSVKGRLRIVPRKQGPKEIVTKLTKEVQEFINFMELKKKETKTNEQVK